MTIRDAWMCYSEFCNSAILKLTDFILDSDIYTIIGIAILVCIFYFCCIYNHKSDFNEEY